MHPNSAFGLAFALDYARSAQHDELASACEAKALDWYALDSDYPAAWEPSGTDFFSPALIEADLMRRILQPEQFAEWLRAFLPQIPDAEYSDWLPPARSSDPFDGKLSHLDGLSLSRAWMLEGIAHALPGDDARRAAVLSAARAHGYAGLGAISAASYAGAHWLGSFAVYYLTRRGIT